MEKCAPSLSSYAFASAAARWGRGGEVRPQAGAAAAGAWCGGVRRVVQHVVDGENPST
jgi:hypothetical protein